MKNAFNILLLFLVLPLLGTAQEEQQKTINKAFSGKERVSITHRYGPLQVEKSTDGQVKLVATLSARTKEAGDMQLLEKQFDLEIIESGDLLEVKTKFDIENWNSRNDIISLKFKDGSRLKQVKNLKITFKLQIPNLQALKLANKYDEINILEDINTDLEIVLYDGRLKTANIQGTLTVDTKYSKGSIGNFQNAALKFYDSTFNLGTGKDIQLISKYSKLEFRNATSLTINSYDDKISWKDVGGNIAIIDKYSDFVGGNFKNGKLDLYDSQITIKNGEDIQAKSKYTKFRLGEVNTLSFELSYDDKVEALSLGNLKSTSKYTDYIFGKLQNGMQINSYDDTFQIGQFVGPLEGIDFTGKYSDIKFGLPPSAVYRIEAHAKYGKIQYSESQLETTYYKEKNDEIELKGKTKDATDSSPLILIESYDGKIILN